MLPIEATLAGVRLLQLVNPALPIGGYSYSQGLELAVETGWIRNVSDFGEWLNEWIDGPLLYQELPLLRRLQNSAVTSDLAAFEYWSCYALACRDTAELRQEEQQRAVALWQILRTLALPGVDQQRPHLQRTPLAGLAWAAALWSIDPESVLIAHAWSTLENRINCGVKLIPLGQSTGQRLQYDLAPQLVNVVRQSLEIADEDIGFSAPAVAEASSRHEMQYSRIYRS